jgi:hypothetical protein
MAEVARFETPDQILAPREPEIVREDAGEDHCGAARIELARAAMAPARIKWLGGKAVAYRPAGASSGPFGCHQLR